MKKYTITVNGTAYEVEVEDMGGAVASAPKAAAPKAAPAPAAAPAPKAAAAPAPAAKPVAAGAATISAPMPGKVLEVKVKVGDAVKAGDVIMVLEAMKMQNEIMAPADGTISDVRVSAGQTVGTGDVMIVM
ncbi:biotin/lipoyl-containing protein [uncultured Phascolarctobacterium sp.]|uniref:biotin/lipoyl-containing protein n=1 Tax=uncultured Phascolarctobacterium sp. TaxID=512296 RepID=UPI0025D3EC92|nr:biotin/lipoyl-containing protein [uncultured Phascolarctobacterium sp.]